MGQFHSFAFFSTLFASFVTVHSFQHHLLERLSFPILFSCCLSCKLADHTHLSLFLGSLFSSIDLCLFFFLMLYKILWFSVIHQESAIGTPMSPPSQTPLTSPSSFHPSRLSQSPCLSPLNHTANSHSVQFSYSVVSDSLQPQGLQHARPPCPSPTPGVHPDSRPLSQ